jgi:ubiquinone/menaquinone biosynthesis C-methylase UbiE
MGTGRNVETRGHVVGFKEEIGRTADLSAEAFLTWFDDAADSEESFVRGAWDFTIHIAQPLAPYLCMPEKKTVLEVGHGAGRILASAARHFGEAIGIDVHDRNDLVRGELAARGVGNVRLLETDGRGIPLPDASVDVAYTFIVFQHIERIAIFESYLREIHRALRRGGVAMIYFGRWNHWSLARRSPLFYAADRISERLLLPHGYREMKAPVNHTNLIITLGHAVHLARAAGFEILDRVVSRKHVPDGTMLYGGQHGLVLRRR